MRMIKPKYETIVWDLDGTILDSLGISVDVWQQVLPQHGFKKPTELDVAHNYHGTLQDTARGLATNASEEQITILLKDFLRLDNEYIKDADHHLFEDAVRLAQRAHGNGIQQIVVTNRAHGHNRKFSNPRNLIHGSRLQPFINTVLCGDEVHERKPSAKVLDGVDYDPEATLVVGDQFVDAQLAANLGCKAILVSRAGDPIAHIDKLAGNMDHIEIVDSLDKVQL